MRRDRRRGIVARLKRSQHFQRTLHHQSGLSETQGVEQFRAGNLLGPPDEVIEQVRAFERAGVSHLGVVIVGDSICGVIELTNRSEGLGYSARDKELLRIFAAYVSSSAPLVTWPIHLSTTPRASRPMA